MNLFRKLAQLVFIAAFVIASQGAIMFDPYKSVTPITFTYIGKATSSTSSLNFASLDAGTRQSGDLLIYMQYSRTGAGGLSLVTPSGFTELGNSANGTVNRGQISSKISDGTEGSVTGMNGGSDNQKMGLVFRPSRSLATVSGNAYTGECTTGNPTSKSVAVSGTSSYPALLLGFMSNRSGGVISPRTVTPAMTEQASGTQSYAHYLEYDASASDMTAYDMDDETDQCIMAGYLTFT